MTISVAPSAASDRAYERPSDHPASAAKRRRSSAHTQSALRRFFAVVLPVRQAGRVDPDLEALAWLNSHLAESLSAVTADNSGWSTPCADWELADLVDHVVGGNWFTTRILGGQTADAALAEVVKRFETGSASISDATASIRDQYVAFGQRGTLEGTWHHVAGELTGREVVRLRLHDLIVHTWDIQQTLNPPAALPDALVEWGLSELGEPGSLTAEHFGISPSGRVCDGAADKAMTYLRSFGRAL